MVMRTSSMMSLFCTGLLVTAASVAHADGNTREHRLDRKGDRINERLDRRGERAGERAN